MNLLPIHPELLPINPLQPQPINPQLVPVIPQIPKEEQSQGPKIAGGIILGVSILLALVILISIAIILARLYTK